MNERQAKVWRVWEDDDRENTLHACPELVGTDDEVAAWLSAAPPRQTFSVTLEDGRLLWADEFLAEHSLLTKPFG